MSCAECGKEGGASLKTCRSCINAKYCNAECQKNHWPKHKKECKLRATILRDELLFKDPPAKEDCPICFLPMPVTLICCVSFPPATISSVPIYNYAIAHEELATEVTDGYYPCCGKNICRGREHSFRESGNGDIGKCPFCNSDRGGKTDGELVAEMMKRVAANDAASISLLAGSYYHGRLGLQQDWTKALELYVRAADLGCCKAHNNLAKHYHDGGDLKKAKFHVEAAAMAGNEEARYNLGYVEYNSGNKDRAVKHFMIATSAGCYRAMHVLRTCFEKGVVSKESIDSTLTAYNNSCVEMRSEARDACIRAITKRI